VLIEKRVHSRPRQTIPRQHESFSERYSRGPQPDCSAIEFNRILELRELAADGLLAATAAAALPARRHTISGAAFAVAWPVVFSRLTRGIERRRGHGVCASSVFRMAQECLDRFYDDVESAVYDLLAHATSPIRDIEGWIVSRLNAATVDGHRRRRGQIGALQRPRVPRWLAVALDDNPWLTELAVQILVWVGVSSTAGTELWPLEAWTLRRGTIVGDPVHSDAGTVAREVETVLAAMRTRPTWYSNFVERPMGHKQAPLANSVDAPEFSPLLLIDRDDDAHLTHLAAQALAAIEARIDDHEDPARTVTDVIRAVFTGDASDDLDRPPLSTVDYDRRVCMVLGDPDRLQGVVAAVMRILDPPRLVAVRQ